MPYHAFKFANIFPNQLLFSLLLYTVAIPLSVGGLNSQSNAPIQTYTHKVSIRQK